MQECVCGKSSWRNGNTQGLQICNVCGAVSVPLPLNQGVGIIIIASNLSGIWMNQRTGTKDLVGYYQPAGGRVEPGETLTQAAIRELREETGIVADEYQLVQVIQKIYPKSTGGRYTSTQFALITSKIPKNTEPHLHSDWMLMPWAEIPKLQCFDAIRELFGTS